MGTLDRLGRRGLFTVFVVSGFSGLIYESIWTQYLKLFLGHAAYAQTLVLAIFMGGLALGSQVVARYSSRLRNLLWGYVLVEALTGVLGLVFHRVFVATTDFSFATVIPALPAGWGVNLYKWALGTLLILPQSTLLGMTFPLISSGLIRRWPERPGQSLATLYFTNSLGAAVGVLVSGFVLIDKAGLPGTLLTAGLLNIALALVVWLLIRGRLEPVPVQPAAAPASSATDEVAKWFVTAAFLTGIASFMYEIGWIRMLSLVLGSSTHSFELMLSAFIFGLAFGGLFVRKRIETLANAEIYLGVVLLIMGCLAALTLPGYNAVFGWMAWALQAFTHTPGGYVAFNAMGQTIAAFIMIPTTFCAGMTLPLLTHALMRRSHNESAIGTIYSVNTLGAIFGVLLTVHVLMPVVGVKGVILGGAAIHIALGLSRLVPVRKLHPKAVGTALAAGIGVLAFAAFGVKLDPARMVAGVYRTGLVGLPPGVSVKYLRDGKTATISLLQQFGMVTISTNGKPDAQLQMGEGAVSDDEVTMVMAAAIPLSMHPHPARIANIGFGSGLTTHELLSSDQLERLDSVEIEPRMVEAARIGFGARIHDVMEDPRSHIVFEDAKTFFAASRERYDIIVSEPSNPWVSGVSSLFSDEFYGRITQYMQPGGYFVQWMQVYETDLTVFASVAKALSAHFDSYRFYDLGDSDILIVATRGAPLPDSGDRIFKWPRMRADLERIGVQSVADVRARIIGDEKTLGRVLRALPVPANSDYFPFVDLNAIRLRYLKSYAVELPQLTLLPVPFLELTLGGPTLASTAEPSVKSALARDTRVRGALQIRKSMASGNLEGLEIDTAAALLLINMSAEQCADAGGQNLWKASARRISDMTSAYLTPGELTQIWDRVRATPCYRQVAGEHHTWADLFAAIAQRDAARIGPLGAGLLDPARSPTREEVAYLTTITAAAYLRTGEPERAGALLKAQAVRLDQPGQFALPLRELVELSRSRPATSLASTAPAAH